jgi:5S rRNA maturation endonuclease (ribonuclease M5)
MRIFWRKKFANMLNLIFHGGSQLMRNSPYRLNSEASSLIDSLSAFISKLNSEVNPLVVVEGPRDAQALRTSGFKGEIFMLCHNQNLRKLEDYVSGYNKIIVLVDNDNEGKKLAEKTSRALEGKAKIDLFYRRRLLAASKGRIRHIEELKSNYAQLIGSHLSRDTRAHDLDEL